MQETHGNQYWITLTDAARALGVDPDFLRYRALKGELQSYRDAAGRVHVARHQLARFEVLLNAQHEEQETLRLLMYRADPTAEGGVRGATEKEAEEAVEVARRARVSYLRSRGFDDNGYPLAEAIR